MTTEQKDKFIKMYNQGYTYKDISLAIGIRPDTVAHNVTKMKRSGELGERRRYPSEEFRTKTAVTSWEKYKELYESGMPIDDIAKHFNTSEGYARKRINSLISEGKIKRREPIKRKPKQRKKSSTEFHIRENAVKCTVRLSSTCIYGYESPNPQKSLCRFLDVTGRCRSSICPNSACTVYEKITKDNPRRRGIDEEFN